MLQIPVWWGSQYDQYVTDLLHAEGKAGSLVDDSGHFYKPLQVRMLSEDMSAWEHTP